MSNPTNTCGITVIATNNTGQGNLTFSTLNFLEDGNLLPTGFPPIVLPTLADGDTGTILIAMVSNGMYDGHSQPETCAGSAVFNFPGGTLLTITWNLNSGTGGSMPSIVPGLGYRLPGSTTPTTDGYNYTFNITIESQ